MRKNKNINKLTFEEFCNKNRRRNKTSFKHCADWSALEWCGAAAGELGEMVNLVKKVHRGDKIDPKLIGKEIADTICYLDDVAAKFGLSLQKCLIDKFNEVSDRVSSKIRL